MLYMVLRARFFSVADKNRPPPKKKKKEKKKASFQRHSLELPDNLGGGHVRCEVGLLLGDVLVPLLLQGVVQVDAEATAVDDPLAGACVVPGGMLRGSHVFQEVAVGDEPLALHVVSAHGKHVE